jgi:sugar/nucleoside kinase (ribokinase family)
MLEAEIMDLLAIGGITFDYLFWVDRLPEKHFEGIIKGQGRFYGGRAPNVAVAAAKLGIKTGLVSSVGEDFASEGYEGYLRAIGVDLRGVIKVPKKKTKQIFIFTDLKGNQITFFDYGAEQHFREMSVPSGLIKESRIVHISSSGDYRFNIRCARFAYENDVSVSFDPGNDPFIGIFKYLKTMMQCSEFLFMNDIELLVIMKRLRVSKIGELLDFGPRIVVVIRKSDKSSLIHTRDGVERIPSAIQVQKDPTGASDGYIAAFLSAHIKGYDLKKAGMLGATEASFVAEKRGAQTNFPNWNALHKRYEFLLKRA